MVGAAIKKKKKKNKKKKKKKKKPTQISTCMKCAREKGPPLFFHIYVIP